MATDLAPFAGAVGGGFFIGLITGYAIKKVIKLVAVIIGLTTGYAIKKVIKLAAVIVGLIIATLVYLEYQRILNLDWHKVQAVSQNGIDWVADALTHVSNTMVLAIQVYCQILGFL